MWDLAAARKRATLREATAPVLAVAFSANGKRLAAGAADGTIKVWDTTTGETVHECKGHIQVVTSLAWTPDDKGLVSGSAGGIVKVWDLAAPQGPLVCKGYEKVLCALAFTPDGRAVTGVDRSGNLLVSEVATGRIRMRHKLQTTYGIAFSAALAPDGNTVAVGGPEPTVRVFEVATGRERIVLSSQASVINTLAFAPDGRVLAVATGQFNAKAVPPIKGQRTGAIKLWNLTTGKELLTLTGYRSFVKAMAFAPDGKTLAAAAADGTVKLWDVATGQDRLTFAAGPETRAIAFSPDGRRLAVAAGETITLREAATGKVYVTIQGYSHEAASLAFSPDGRRLVSGGGESDLGHGGGVKVWDTTTGLELLSLGESSVELARGIRQPRDGGRLAAAMVTGPGIDFLGQTVGDVTVWDGRPPPLQRNEGPAGEFAEPARG